MSPNGTIIGGSKTQSSDGPDSLEAFDKVLDWMLDKVHRDESPLSRSEVCEKA